MSDLLEQRLCVLRCTLWAPPSVMVAVMACAAAGCHRAAPDTRPESDFRAARPRAHFVVHDAADTGQSPADGARATGEAPESSAAGGGSRTGVDDGTVMAREAPAAPPPAAPEARRSRAPPEEPSEAAADGASSARDRAAFPGRQSRNKPLSASAAAGRAREHLARARQARMRGDPEATHEAALDAYEAASPHAATDERCREACEAAAKVVSETAPRARPTGGPTSFE
jgi:type IV secretory pathway VirB10-like protein